MIANPPSLKTVQQEAYVKKDSTAILSTTSDRILLPLLLKPVSQKIISTLCEAFQEFKKISCNQTDAVYTRGHIHCCNAETVTFLVS